MLASGATYVARGYTRKMDHLRTLISGGIAHKGFAFIDVLQICATFFPAADYYSQHIYELSGNDRSGFEAASAKAREWDYNSDAPIALGTFFERTHPTFDERMKVRQVSAEDRDRSLRELLTARS